jgi:hypothetical protein
MNGLKERTKEIYGGFHLGLREAMQDHWSMEGHVT